MANCPICGLTFGVGGCSRSEEFRRFCESCIKEHEEFGPISEENLDALVGLTSNEGELNQLIRTSFDKLQRQMEVRPNRTREEMASDPKFILALEKFLALGEQHRNLIEQYASTLPERPPDPKHIYHWRRLSGWITTSGQPTKPQLEEIAALRVKHIINLGLHEHERALADEAAIVAALGMNYIHIPVEFLAPTEGNFEVFSEKLKAVEGDKVHVHCIANLRVTAFLYRFLRDKLRIRETVARRLMDSVWRPGGVWAKFIGDEASIKLEHRPPDEKIDWHSMAFEDRELEILDAVASMIGQFLPVDDDTADILYGNRYLAGPGWGGIGALNVYEVLGETRVLSKILPKLEFSDELELIDREKKILSSLIFLTEHFLRSRGGGLDHTFLSAGESAFAILEQLDLLENAEWSQAGRQLIGDFIDENGKLVGLAGEYIRQLTS